VSPQEQSAAESRWQRLAYQARGTAIAGGSTFIQRNIVAERILGLPRS
jgi:alkylation response protein AidB-like acyl-CoA dehydrogenase